ncbi:MMPL family transporter [Schleiferiaceae bacterium]|nr:MMPL family transporter [Schleiferiaceae bacterium]
MMAFFGRSVDISYEFAKMLPSTDSVFTTYMGFHEDFTESGNAIVLAAKDDAFFTPSVLNAWADMATRLEKEEEVVGVLSLHNAVDLYLGEEQGAKMETTTIMDGRVDSPQEAFAIRDHYNALPIYHGLLSSRDNTTHLMAITITDKANYSALIFDLFDRLHAETKRFERRTGIEVQISGLPYLRLNNARSIKGEINLFLILTGLVTVLIMLILLRSMRAALIALSVVGVGVIGLYGIMGLLSYKITLFSALLPPLLIVIVVPNCIFFINKYHQEYAKDKDVKSALIHTVKKIGGVAFLTNATTALGFATFILTSSEALVHFGVAASINIFMVFLMSLTIIPVLYSYLSAPKERHYKHLNQKWLVKWIEWLVRTAEGNRRNVYVGALVLAVLGVIGMTKMQTTGNLTTDIHESDPLVTQMRFFEREMGGVVPLEIVIDTKEENGAEKSKVLKRVDRFQDALDTMKHLSRSLSLVDVLKFGRQAYYGGDPLFYALPNNQERTMIATSMPKLDSKDLAFLTNGFLDEPHQKLRVSVQVEDLTRPEMMGLVGRVQSTADSIFDRASYNLSYTGASIIFLRSTKFLINNLVVSLLLAIMVISLLMAALFKTFRMVVVAIIPNLLPLLMTAGIMGWFGIPVKPSTVLIFSIAFGISVDDTLHYLARYRQELVGNGHNIARAAISAIRETGPSMFYTSIVLFAGFFIFLASSFGGTQALGLLVSITLVFAMFSNLILLPSLLMSLDKVMTASDMEDILIDLAEDE